MVGRSPMRTFIDRVLSAFGIKQRLSCKSTPSLRSDSGRPSAAETTAPIPMCWCDNPSPQFVVQAPSLANGHVGNCMRNRVLPPLPEHREMMRRSNRTRCLVKWHLARFRAAEHRPLATPRYRVDHDNWRSVALHSLRVVSAMA